MKYYLTTLFVALQLAVIQMHAMDIGTDPVGNVTGNGEKEQEPSKEEEKPNENHKGRR